jgi:hypothetical protein
MTDLLRHATSCLSSRSSSFKTCLMFTPHASLVTAEASYVKCERSNCG